MLPHCLQGAAFRPLFCCHGILRPLQFEEVQAPILIDLQSFADAHKRFSRSPLLPGPISVASLRAAEVAALELLEMDLHVVTPAHFIRELLSLGAPPHWSSFVEFYNGAGGRGEGGGGGGGGGGPRRRLAVEGEARATGSRARRP